MKRLISLGLGALFLALFLGSVLPGCGGGGGGAGNPDAAAVIGTAPDDPSYGAASADLMSKMHGGPMPGAVNKKEAQKSTSPGEKKSP
jgi:hypothetical protein